MADRIRRPKDFEDFMNKLCKKGDGKTQIFSTLKDCLVFCAALGAKHDRKEPFSDTSEPIMLHLFNGEYDKAFINALAIYDTKEAIIIDPTREDERIKIFEEFASGGLHILQSELGNLELDIEKQMVSLISKEEQGMSIIDDISNF